VRPKTIVYFEWIIFGTILLSVLRAYLYDPVIGQIATDRVFDLRFEVMLVVGILVPVLIFPLTLTLLVSRRRSKIAMWVLIAWFVLGLSLFLVSLVQSIGELLGSEIVPVIGRILQFISESAAVGLLFTPCARRWMRREDKLLDAFH
jgi:hypothetical protein